MMNEFIVSTKGSLWECSCPNCVGDRKGSRKGASINTLSRDERQQLYDMIDAKLKSDGKPWDYVYTVTGKDNEGPAYEAFANMPENKDMVNGLILEITNSRNGSRKGSRKGDALAQQIIGDNVEEDSDGYNFYDARNALRREGYSEDEIEDNIDTWMYNHMN